jgi:uncharacterized membrane-anchored protein YjiN (DUF445 family)
VNNKWLSPNVIAEKLNEVDLAKIFWTSSTQQPTKWIRLIQNIVLKFANELDNPKLRYPTKNTKEQISGIDLASPLGTWLEKIH